MTARSMGGMKEAGPVSEEALREAMARAGIVLLPYQDAALTCQERFTWNCWARQTGKSFTFGLKRLIRAISRQRNQIILSAGQRQSREVMEKIRSHCQALKIWHEFHGLPFHRDSSIRQLEIRLSRKARIIGLPANPMTARGYSGDVFLDEFAMHRDDDAIWAALFPTLLRGGGQLDVASTPRGRKNMFYRLGDNSRFHHTTLTLEQAIAEGLAADLEVMRAGIGSELDWRQEFCCEFVDESTSFMTYGLIRGCHDPRLGTRVDWSALMRSGVEAYAGVDVGRHRDITAVWLWERQGEAFITRGLLTMENAPFNEQESQIGRLLGLRGLRRCCIDATGLGLHLAERLVERFGDHRVEAVTFTSALKNELAGLLRVMAERGLLRIPADEQVADDWHSITRVVSSGGHVRFDADRSSGGHADRFWAAALGLYAADGCGGGGPGLITSGALRFGRKGAW
ncbi:MAG TPA: terminase family protein [Phycisphaerae bacterium]|nr:terminase family protein [Phycisphaerae bacterium]